MLNSNSNLFDPNHSFYSIQDIDLNILKGGDFMERKEQGPASHIAVYAPVREVAPGRYRGVEKVGELNGRIPGTSEDPFPKVVGRTRFDPVSDPALRGAEELAITTGREESLDQPR